MKFTELLEQIENFDMSKKVIGRSVFGLPIYAFCNNQNTSPILVVGAIHGREWITALLVLKLMEKYKDDSASFIFVPLANPDGVKISMDNGKSLNLKQKRELVFAKNVDFSLWKANGRGVDINVNFDAEWGTGKSNVFYPSSENYVGKSPESEPETRALSLILSLWKPNKVVSFHTKGEVIYYGFQAKGKRLEELTLEANEISKQNGYKVEQTKNSAGGLADFALQKYDISSYTIECGREELSHPLGKQELNEIYVKNKNVLNIFKRQNKFF